MKLAHKVAELNIEESAQEIEEELRGERCTTLEAILVEEAPPGAVAQDCVSLIESGLDELMGSSSYPAR